MGGHALLQRWGLDPEGDLGERHDPETHAIHWPYSPRCARPSSTCSEQITTRPMAPRSATISMSATLQMPCAGFRLFAQRRRKRCLNLATGKGTSVKELLDAVSLASVRLCRSSMQHAGLATHRFSTRLATRARTLLGWNPQYTDINLIVKTAADCSKPTAIEDGGTDFQSEPDLLQMSCDSPFWQAPF